MISKNIFLRSENFYPYRYDILRQHCFFQDSGKKVSLCTQRLERSGREEKKFSRPNEIKKKRFHGAGRGRRAAEKHHYKKLWSIH